VGTDRRPIGLRTARGDHLVGPDNGLLLPAAGRLGGIAGAVELTEPAYRMPEVSTSFHGRDIFAPAAAHLALGVPLEAFGPSIAAHELVSLGIPEPLVAGRSLHTVVVYRDTFGNAKLSGLADDLVSALGPLAPGDPLIVELAAHGDAPARVLRLAWQATFAGAGEGRPLLYLDSYGRLGLAIDRGNAVQELGLVDDQPVAISRDEARE
jgi:S-adenosylmethionine hydrolase